MKFPMCFALLLMAACGASSTSAPTTAPVEPSATTEAIAVAPEGDSIAMAVASSARPEEDRVRDADRKPAETMRFFGIQPGMTVADLMAGRGYYSELFSVAVGSEGRVLVQNNKFVLERFAEGPLSERLARLTIQNTERVDQELDALVLPAEQVDVAFLGLFYHDAFWMEVDRAKMNAAIFATLKPGGIYAITDHHAEAGSRDRDTKTLHRVDAALVKAEVLAAGFEFVGESEILRHPEDARTINVFDDAIRGKTDRFVYKFRKPN